MTSTKDSIINSNTCKTVIVFDLDETIISCSLIPSSYYSFKIKVGKRNHAYIKIRPGFHEFIKEISHNFEIFFFTASLKIYANKIIDVIAPETPADHRFFKCSCKNISGYLVKDLSLIKRPLNKIILIDDIKGSALLQPENIINISPWYGDNDDSVLLDQLLPLLIKIEKDSKPTMALRKIIYQEKNNYKDLGTFI